MNTRFAWAYVLAGFMVFAIAWFIWRTPDAPPADWTPHPALAGAVATQNPETDFTPDATNVSPTTHLQLESLRKRIVESPDDTTHLFRLARLLQDAHQPAEAARHYRHYLALHPDNYQAWLDMTQSLGQAEQWEEALESVRQMLERYPDDPAALYNMGAIYANLSQPDEARDIWQRLIERDVDPDITLLSRQSLSRLTPAR